MARDAARRSTAAARKKLAEAARDHEDALRAAGLPAGAIDRYEALVRVLGGKPRPESTAAQVLVPEVQREVSAIQAAVRKEFPGNAAFQAVFRAGEAVPEEA